MFVLVYYTHFPFTFLFPQLLLRWQKLYQATESPPTALCLAQWLKCVISFYFSISFKKMYHVYFKFLRVPVFILISKFTGSYAPQFSSYLYSLIRANSSKMLTTLKWKKFWTTYSIPTMGSYPRRGQGHGLNGPWQRQAQLELRAVTLIAYLDDSRFQLEKIKMSKTTLGSKK